MTIIIAVLIATGVWAVVASIIAHNGGRDVKEMAERHNNVAEALRDKTVKMFMHRDEWDKVRDKMTADLATSERHADNLFKHLKEVRTALDETQNALIYAAQIMRIPAELRERDERGRFVKMTAEELAGKVLDQVARMRGE